MARIFRSLFKNLFFMGKRILFFAKDPEADIEQSGVKKDHKPSGKEIEGVKEKIAKDFDKRVKIDRSGPKLIDVTEKIKLRRPITFGQRIRTLFQQIIPFLTATLLNVTIEGLENIPDASRLLIVANHGTFIDVPLLSLTLRKYLLNIRWVINKGIYKLWYLKWVYMIHQCLVADGGTVEKMKKELDENRWVLIFPEGGQRLCTPTIEESEKKKPRRGAAVVALSTGVTILPICIIGAEKVLPARSFRLNIRQKITVRIGKPTSYQKIEEGSITEELLDKTKKDIIDRIYELTDDKT